jgi:rod shape-determining protein MreC
VQVLRSGVRTIALGTGRSTALELPYVPQNYDVKIGDVLVTSGLGRVFPYGLPVARVTRVERDPAQPLAQIHAVPLAHIDADREVLFIWGRPGHPAAPATSEALAVGAAPVEAPKPAQPKPKPKPAAPKPAENPAGNAADPQDSAPPTESPAPASPTPEAPAT